MWSERSRLWIQDPGSIFTGIPDARPPSYFYQCVAVSRSGCLRRVTRIYDRGMVEILQAVPYRDGYQQNGA